MKYRPILFNGEMVRAVLSGQKTQTRRVMKHQPEGSWAKSPIWVDAEGYYHSGDYSHAGTKSEIQCPYGAKGDRLWVRETFTEFDGAPNGVAYRADCVGEYADLVESLKPWKPSIFMRRIHSRITLEVTDVRVERIQEISEKDAWKEGIGSVSVGGFQRPCPVMSKGGFRELWDSINKSRGYGWDINPWVWVVEFRRVEL